MFEACFNQGDINHVTGDVHFLTYFLRHEKTILTIHDCESLERFHGIKRMLFKFFWYTLPVWRVHFVTVVSSTTKQHLMEHVHCPSEKIKVIPCCLLKAFRAYPKSFNKRKPLALQIGTAHNKNLSRVAESLEGIPCRLQIIGLLTEEQKTTLKKFRIDYEAHGEVSDQAILEAYHDCDFVLFVSTYEGFGMPIIEANAIGRPVLTSNVSSMPEVAGDAACLVDPYDPIAIREAVKRVIHDSSFREDLIRRGYINAARFSPEVVAEQYAELYFHMHDKATN